MDDQTNGMLEEFIVQFCRKYVDERFVHQVSAEIHDLAQKVYNAGGSCAINSVLGEALNSGDGSYRP